ncbi:FG-GAP-like repeat-containing protein [Fimbriiglobus ruber]|uniref:FG-GAP repeat protein n=1 Tax=Fimbriiglobus ruber TaxID=1908690 RepID=A0A225DWX1_9BACT|nr:FG-GAP-like repeat-containing protein [Fimbriiglobus ruber]OWK40815.1 hypothetical protein FRUB_04707 [Fimbriiglobus ruber]
MVVQPDGKIVTVDALASSSESGIEVVRYLADGTLDTSFGTNGVVVYPTAGTTTVVTGVALTPDGKIVVVGYRSGQSDSFVLRLNPDGSFDSTFGTGGVVHLASGTVGQPGTGVAVLADGSIALAGIVSNTPSPTSSNPSVFLETLGPDGTQDVVTTEAPPADQPAGAGEFQVLVRPDGTFDEIATVGGTGIHALVYQYTLAGALDPTFGTNGVATVPLPSGSVTGALWGQLLPDGGMLITSYGSGADGNVESDLIRLTPSGTVDTSFNGTGTLEIPDAYIRGTGDLSDGRILALVQLTTGVYQLDLVTAAGALDSSFGSGGQLTLTGLSPTGFSPSNGADVVAATSAGIAILGVIQPSGGSPNAAVALVEPGPTPIVVVAPPPSVPSGVPPVVVTPPVTPPTVPPAKPPEVTVPTGQEVVLADVNGDGVNDIITTGTDGTTLEVIDGATGADLVAPFSPFGQGFTGTLSVVAADLSGTGKADVIVTAGYGGAARVIVYDGATLAATGTTPLFTFFGIPDPAFRGGAHLAIGDVNGDGVPDVIVSAGSGAGRESPSGTGLRSWPATRSSSRTSSRSSRRSGTGSSGGRNNYFTLVPTITCMACCVSWRPHHAPYPASPMSMS